jgi:hypothetical protein
MSRQLFRARREFLSENKPLGGYVRALAALASALAG